MSIPTIPSKLFVPPIRDRALSRSRLTELVSDGLSGKLTLISTQAGFGKTTFLSDCVHQCDSPVAWITLDQGDNDNNRFLTYFIAALENISKGFGQSIQGALQANQPVGAENILSGLINEFIEIRKQIGCCLTDHSDNANHR